MTDTRYYTQTDAALALGITRKGVVSALRRGSLKPAITTVGGLALFDDASLDAYRRDYLGKLANGNVGRPKGWRYTG